MNKDNVPEPARAASGLSSAEAATRLRRFGPNELPRTPRRRWFRIVLDVLREPMFLLLVAAALLYLVVGDPAEASLLAAFAIMSIGLVVVQENRSERALEALRQLAAPTARVMRGGQMCRIAARELVPGDVLLVGEGERIAADGWVIRAEAASVDESLLTGESVPVSKRARLADDSAPPHPGGDATAFAYSGSLAVAGHLVIEVARTGVHTASGRIGLSLATIETGATPLQHSVRRLVRLFGSMAAVVTLAVLLGYGWVLGDWHQGALSGIAIAMSLLPEEFPMALAVFLALGAWRMARVRVLARRPAMVETLGSASVLCVDKTGTLTENRMQVMRLHPAGEAAIAADAPLPPACAHLLHLARLACKRQAHDPMDAAINALADAQGDLPPMPATLEREYGLGAGRMAFARVWRDADGARLLASKGAPETLLADCDAAESVRREVLAEVQSLAAEGLRVLAVASAADPGDLPEDPTRIKWRYEGLLALADPLRPRAREAVTAARQAGLRVVMITGDYPATALAIAGEAGIDRNGGVLSGEEIDALDEAALADRIAQTQVCARVRPEQKLRLVQALRATGAVVAMTGDGVNDAPALRAAHIGVAMGQRGTDVAREAAGIVLLDDEIAHIGDAIRLGRRIFENLRKVLVYIVAIHVPIAGLALAPLLMGLPPLLLPMHVVLIEMVVDPICSIAFENEPAAPDLMQRGPRSPGEALVGSAQLLLGSGLGILLLATCLAGYAWAQALHGADAARTLAIVALTAGNLMLVRVIATPGATLPALFSRGRRAYWVIVAVVSLVLSACIGIEGLAELFDFAHPGWPMLLAAIAAGALTALLGDLIKLAPAARRVLNVSSP
jgi:Ca2+-transporting ATPase